MNTTIYKWSLLLAVGLVSMVLRADPVVVESKNDLILAATNAKPGAIIRISPGTYPGGIHLDGLAGNEKSPIVFEPADPDNPPLFSSEKGGNSAIHLSGCSFITLRGLHVTGFPANGINADDGGADRQGPAIGLRFENLVIEHTGPKGNHDALKLSGVSGFEVEGCTFRGWGGSGIDMVGCHQGVISQCVFEGHPEFSQSNGVQIKGGSSKISVIRSFFLNPGHRGINLGGSTGIPYFRPADATTEASDIEVAGNRFIGGQAPIAWVGSNRGHVHHNTIVRPEKWVGRILQENTDPRFDRCQNGRFENNLIIFDARVKTFMNVGGNTKPESFTFRQNAWFNVDGPNHGPTGLPVKESDSVIGIDPELDPTSKLPVAQSTDPRLKGIGADSYPASAIPANKR